MIESEIELYTNSKETDGRSNLDELLPQSRIELEGAVLPFKEARSGRTSNLRIMDVLEILGRGNFAEYVASVNVNLADTDEIGPTSTMVVKNLKQIMLKMV